MEKLALLFLAALLFIVLSMDINRREGERSVDEQLLEFALWISEPILSGLIGHRIILINTWLNFINIAFYYRLNIEYFFLLVTDRFRIISVVSSLPFAILFLRKRVPFANQESAFDGSSVMLFMRDGLRFFSPNIFKRVYKTAQRASLKFA